MFEGTSSVYMCVIMLKGTIHTIYNFQVDKLLNVWWKHTQIIMYSALRQLAVTVDINVSTK